MKFRYLHPYSKLWKKILLYNTHRLVRKQYSIKRSLQMHEKVTSEKQQKLYILRTFFGMVHTCYPSLISSNVILSVVNLIVIMGLKLKPIFCVVTLNLQQLFKFEIINWEIALPQSHIQNFKRQSFRQDELWHFRKYDDFSLIFKTSCLFGCSHVYPYFCPLPYHFGLCSNYYV